MLTNTKPTITLKKVDESEFVNAATYWTVSTTVADTTYELRIAHAFPADEFAFFCYAYGDGLRIVEQSEYDDRVETIAMNEPEDCNVCRTMTDAEREMAFNGTTQDDEGWSCTACHAKSRERAESIVDQDWHVGTANELAIRDELRRHWDAFALLFNPAINSFSDGFSRVR